MSASFYEQVPVIDADPDRPLLPQCKAAYVEHGRPVALRLKGLGENGGQGALLFLGRSEKAQAEAWAAALVSAAAIDRELREGRLAVRRVEAEIEANRERLKHPNRMEMAS